MCELYNIKKFFNDSSKLFMKFIVNGKLYLNDITYYI